MLIQKGNELINLILFKQILTAHSYTILEEKICKQIYTFEEVMLTVLVTTKVSLGISIFSLSFEITSLCANGLFKFLLWLMAAIKMFLTNRPMGLATGARSTTEILT